jgi:hypothetical protein
VISIITNICSVFSFPSWVLWGVVAPITNYIEEDEDDDHDEFYDIDWEFRKDLLHASYERFDFDMDVSLKH